MKNLIDLCNEYGIPITQDGDRWKGPCIWSFDEDSSLIIYPEEDRWEDFITGNTGDILDFVAVVEDRLKFLKKDKFDSEDWFAEPIDESAQW